METLADRIKERLRILGITPQEASVAAGLNKDAIRNILRGKSLSPRGITLNAIAKALQCSAEWLHTGSEEAEPDAPPPDPPQLEVVRASVTADNDFPVYAAVEAGEGDVIFSAEPIEWVKRPEPLFRIDRAFALLVAGDSMSPVYEDGDMVLVHPTKPPRAGRDIVLTKSDLRIGGVRAKLKRLVKTDTHNWTLRQFNPDRTWKEKKADWPYAFSTVGKYDRR